MKHQLTLKQLPARCVLLCLGLGVSLEVAAGLVTTAGEGVVLAICQVFPVKFSTVKIAFDVTLVCISILTSLLFLGGLEGIREGTVAAAVCVGLVTRQCQKPVKWVTKKLLPTG